MKKILTTAALAGLGVSSALAELKEGDVAPSFTTQASFAGKAFTYALKDQLRKGPVVVYFYPTAFGGGCSIQAHAFAQNFERFAAAGASIVGVSLDDIGRLNAFSADPQYCASKFPVASDVDGRIARSFDLDVNESTRGRKDKRGVVVDHGSVARTTFILNKGGQVIATVGGVAPLANVEAALAAVQKVAAAQ
ncbi:peroxiredoxin [Aquabacterium soli]|uniref:thioredoxin-dependent peroxiredoxin n=1 Tax=Aquabacterium soli TaxID=2493092 RepID=A0A3R8S9X7_9BURK|nr:peroxiredoxin [Aquabacterium soli]RRS05649.1 peroxiredoxin [Aquabacterium soli]